MKFTSYQPAVENGGVLRAPAYHVTRDINAYGGNGAGLAAMTRGIGAVAAVVQKQQDEADAADVMDARNEIMTRITEGLYSENGLLTTGVGENAKGLTERVTNFIKESSRDIVSKQNGRVQAVLKRNLSENFQNFQRVAASQEMREGRAAQKATYSSIQANNQQIAALNYNNPEMLDSMLRQQRDIAAVQSMREGWSGETLAAVDRDNVTQTVAGAAQAAIDAGDYDTAGKIIAKYRKDINQKTYGDLYQAVQKKQNIRSRDTFVSDIMARHKLPDGTYDMRAVREEIEAKSGQGAYVQSSAIEAVADGFRGMVGNKTTMDNHENGCVEAALKGTSGSNSFAQAEMEKGVVNVQRLIADAREEDSGASVEAYRDGMEIPAGDIIVYFKPGDAHTDENAEHVMVSDGQGGVFGNSSNLDHVVHRPDSIETDGLEVGYVIHTNTEGTRKSAYDPEERDKMWRLAESMDTDNNRMIHQEKERHAQEISDAVENAETMMEAQSIIDNDDSLTKSQKNTLMRYARSKFGTTGQNGRSSGERPYNPEKDIDVLKTAADYLRLEDADNPQGSRMGFTEDKWVKIRQAVERLDQNGILEQTLGSEDYQTYYDIWNENETDPNNLGVQIRNLIQQEYKSGATTGEIVQDLQQSFGIDSSLAMMILSSVDYSLVAK